MYFSYVYMSYVIKKYLDTLKYKKIKHKTKCKHSPLNVVTKKPKANYN